MPIKLPKSYQRTSSHNSSEAVKNETENTVIGIEILKET